MSTSEEKPPLPAQSAAYAEAVAEAVRIIKNPYKEDYHPNIREKSSIKEYLFQHEDEDYYVDWIFDYDERLEIQKNAAKYNQISEPTEFFKFLFFDTYIREGKGANFFIIAHIFKKYISRYITNKESFNLDILNTFNTLFDNKETWEETAYNYDKFNQHLSINRNYILLGGWVSGGGGHAIVIYINKEEDNKHTIYIVNSGAGLGHHGKPNAEGEYPIIIKFENIDNGQVKAIYDITLFFKDRINSDYSDRDTSLKAYKDLLKKNMPDPQFKSEYEEINRIFNNYIKSSFTIYDIIGGDLLYKCMFLILKDKQIYKYDKEQMSGSCTYFSTYYFVKCMLFTETNKDLFSLFMEKIKNLHANAFLLNYTNALRPNNTHKFSVNESRRISTIAPALLKDRDISPLIKERIASLLKKSYTYESLVMYRKKSSYIESKGSFNTFIQIAEEFMNGKKTIKKIKEMLLQYNREFTRSIDERHDGLIHDLFCIISMKCLLECYHAIGKENGEEIIPYTTKEVYETTFYRSDFYKDVIEIIEKLRNVIADVYSSKDTSFDQIKMCKNILMQCLFKIMPMPSTEEFPFNEHVEVNSDNTTFYIDDMSIKIIIQYMYIHNSNQFIYKYSFRKLYSEIFRRRGLLFLNSRDSNTNDIEGYHNRLVFYKYIGLWINHDFWIYPVGLYSINIDKYVNEKSALLNLILNKVKDNINYKVYVYNDLQYPMEVEDPSNLEKLEGLKKLERLKTIAKIITSGINFTGRCFCDDD